MKTILFSDGGELQFVKNGNENFIHFMSSAGFQRGTVNGFSADWGNYWFKQAKVFVDGGYTSEEMFDFIFFDNCALNNDYDFFSDVYKDLHGVRPHFSSEEWTRRVNLAKSRKP